MVAKCWQEKSKILDSKKILWAQKKQTSWNFTQSNLDRTDTGRGGIKRWFEMPSRFSRDGHTTTVAPSFKRCSNLFAACISYNVKDWEKKLLSLSEKCQSPTRILFKYKEPCICEWYEIGWLEVSWLSRFNATIIAYSHPGYIAWQSKGCNN